MKTFPELYAVRPHGDCMEPLYKGGEPLIVSSTAKCEAGDIVIIHFLPQYVRPGDFEAVVKRLRHPLYGMKFPWDPTGSDVVIPIAAEQLNPPRTYHFRADMILAVHKVLGAGELDADGKCIAPRALLEPV